MIKEKERRAVDPYSLKYVRHLIDSGSIQINGNALHNAKNDFGWNKELILKALKALNSRGYCKTDVSKYKPHILIDVYKWTFKGVRIYSHFYIEDGILVVNSFKKE